MENKKKVCLAPQSYWLNCCYPKYGRTGGRGDYTRFNEDVQLHFCLKANRGWVFLIFFSLFCRFWPSPYSATTSSDPGVKKVSELLPQKNSSFDSFVIRVNLLNSFICVGKRTLFTTFPCESLQTHSSVNTFDTFSKEKLLLISTAEGMFGQFITKIPPYNLHGTMAYYTPLYTSYICCQTFKTV